MIEGYGRGDGGRRVTLLQLVIRDNPLIFADSILQGRDLVCACVYVCTGVCTMRIRNLRMVTRKDGYLYPSAHILIIGEAGSRCKARIDTYRLVHIDACALRMLSIGIE